MEHEKRVILSHYTYKGPYICNYNLYGINYTIYNENLEPKKRRSDNSDLHALGRRFGDCKIQKKRKKSSTVTFRTDIDLEQMFSNL